MVIKTSSPGVLVNEIDLTRGTSDAITTNIGALCGPFKAGPVDEVIKINTEAELQATFGNPTDENAEYWWTVSNFLEYGGVCYVVRCDDAVGDEALEIIGEIPQGQQTMRNAADRVSLADPLYVKNKDHFLEDYYDQGSLAPAHFLARNPGTWGNALGVAVIDSGADYQNALSSTDQVVLHGANTNNPEGTLIGGKFFNKEFQTDGYSCGYYINAYRVKGDLKPTEDQLPLMVAFVGEDTNGADEYRAHGVITSYEDGADSNNGVYKVMLFKFDDKFRYNPSDFDLTTLTDTKMYEWDGEGNEVTGKGTKIGFAEFIGSHKHYHAYEDFAPFASVQLNEDFDNQRIVNTLWAPAEYTREEGFERFGWPRQPFNNQKVRRIVSTGLSGLTTEFKAKVDVTQDYAANGIDITTFKPGDYVIVKDATAETPISFDDVDDAWKTDGVTSGFRNNEKLYWTRENTWGDLSDVEDTVELANFYIYSTVTESWTNSYKPAVGDYIHDRKFAFPIEFMGDWYKNQMAFQGIPWYRFSDRPLSTLNALNRGARNDELNILVYDATGAITGSKGNVLESYFGVSKLKGATTPEGENNYYADRINEFSNYIFAHQVLVTAPENNGLDGNNFKEYNNNGKTDIGDTIYNGAYSKYIVPMNVEFEGGVDNLYATLGELQQAYNKFDTENVFDLDYILQGPANVGRSETSEGSLDDAISKANFLISIVEERRDCMCFLSPPRSSVVNQNNSAQVTRDVVQWADEISSSSYAVMDSGYKYQYDRFTDKYRYIPLNGDTAGTLVYSAYRAEPWFSPAGFQRGNIRNVVKLPFNPSRKQRDDLYSHRVNPVVDFPGEGTVLYGDKTALAYSSAFDRINVRRLFLICEKEIAKISKTTLFEFNDDITRTLFKNNVNPFLRNVQSKRGMYDFLVVCDESNNTPEIIDRNEFVADIYIKPSKSINYITLNFVATKTGITFDEAVALNRRNSF